MFVLIEEAKVGVKNFSLVVYYESNFKCRRKGE